MRQIGKQHNTAKVIVTFDEDNLDDLMYALNDIRHIVNIKIVEASEVTNMIVTALNHVREMTASGVKSLHYFMVKSNGRLYVDREWNKSDDCIISFTPNGNYNPLWKIRLYNLTCVKNVTLRYDKVEIMECHLTDYATNALKNAISNHPLMDNPIFN